MNDYFCYIIHDRTGVPVYVGMGRGRRSRRVNGRRNAKINALISFGGTLPPVKVKEGMTQPEAYECERALIAFHGRADLGKGELLNLCDGGKGTPNPSAQTRAKVSAAHKGKPKPPRTAEHCAKIAEAKRNQSPETRAKIGAAHRNKVVSAETRAKLAAAQCGRKATAETRARMSAAQTARHTTINNGAML